jgi:hypothetical protein
VHFPVGRILAASLFVAALAVPAVAHAQGPTPPPQAAPPQVATVSAEPAAPELPVVSGGYSCFVGGHAGIDDADARTTTELVCDELRQKKADPGIYDVRLGKLGGRILMVVTERANGEDRRLLIQSFDEVPIAAPRLVNALVNHTSLEETQNVDNVVSAEARAVKVKPSPGGASIGLVGMSGIGLAPGAAGGFDVGVMFRHEHISFGGHGRAGGIGSGNNKLGFASLDLGVRYHLGEGDTTPFVGGGLGFAYFQANRENGDLTGSGFEGVAEVGVDCFRANRVGAVISLRADLPLFALAGHAYSYTDQSRVDAKRYVVPLSLNVGFSFH